MEPTLQNKEKQIIYILGGPGSGKGTHCERLVRDFQFKHISIGDLMRDEIKSKSQLGSTIEAYVKEGAIVPTKTTIQLLTRAIQKTNYKYLIDGFPRGVEQALMLESSFAEIKFILNFNCSEEILVQRLLNRGLTSGRADDNEETIRKRITTFNEQTMQALKMYEKFGKVTNILSEGQIEDVYKQVLPAIYPNVIFFYGAPVLGKSSVAKKLCERINYTYLDLNKFFEDSQCQNNDEKVNKLMEYLLDNPERNFIIDDFFSTVKQMEVYFKYFIKPNKVFYFQTTKDNVNLLFKLYYELQVDNNIFQYYKTVKEQELQMKRYEQFAISRKEILPVLKSSGVFVELNACQSLQQLELEILGLLKPMIIFAYNSTESQFYSSLCEQMEKQQNFIELSLQYLISTEISRGTALGKELLKYPITTVPLMFQLQLLRKILFNNPQNKRFIISGYPISLYSYKQFEIECCKIDYVMSCADAIQEGKPLQTQLMLESYYNESGRYFLINQADIRYVQQYLVKRKQYALVLGAPAMGKTVISKALESSLGFVIPDYEKITTQLKETLGGEDGPLEELTFQQLATQLKKNLDSQQDSQLTLFDGFPYEDKELKQFVELMGDPSFVILLKGTKDNVTAGFKRKNEIEPETELSEEDIEKINQSFKLQERIFQYFQTVKERSVSIRIFEIDASQKPQKLVQQVLSYFSKKMVICNFNVSGLKIDNCWKLYSELLNNICTKNQIRFVDVRQLIEKEFAMQGSLAQELELQYKMRWSDTPKNYPSNYSPSLIMQLIKDYLDKFQSPQVQVLLFGFPSGDNFQERKSEEQFFPRILDELNAIETQLGTINSAFMINDNFESQEYDDPVQEIMKIVQEQVAKKPQENPEDEDKEKKEEEEDPEKKKRFNPAEYTWTISDGNPKNFAQILCRKGFIEEQINIEDKKLVQVFESKIVELFSEQQQKKFIQFKNCYAN